LQTGTQPLCPEETKVALSYGHHLKNNTKATENKRRMARQEKETLTKYNVMHIMSRAEGKLN